MKYQLLIYWDLIKIGLIGLSVFAGVGLVLSIPLWLLWNWLMPYIFGLPTINIFQAFGLSVLVSLLAPRSIGINNKQNIPDNTDEKLQEVLKDITSKFQA